MPAHVLRGTKQEIADNLARIPGEIHEAIVFVEEPAKAAQADRTPVADDVFGDMTPYMVDVDNVDDFRASRSIRQEKTNDPLLDTNSFTHDADARPTVRRGT